MPPPLPALPLIRDALASAPKPCAAHRRIPPNKKTYQQDPANFREALREALLDEAEGADIMMVKPGLPYLDVIRLLRDNSALPIAAYHVSGGWGGLAGWLGRLGGCAWHGMAGRLGGWGAVVPAHGMAWLGGWVGGGPWCLRMAWLGGWVGGVKAGVRVARELGASPIAAGGRPRSRLCAGGRVALNACRRPCRHAGEYAMLKAAAERGWLNEKDAVLEALLCLKRAGSGGWRLPAAGLVPCWRAADCSMAGRWAAQLQLRGASGSLAPAVPSCLPALRHPAPCLLPACPPPHTHADLILSYYATEAAKWMADDKPSWR